MTPRPSSVVKMSHPALHMSPSFCAVVSRIVQNNESDPELALGVCRNLINNRLKHDCVTSLDLLPWLSCNRNNKCRGKPRRPILQDLCSLQTRTRPGTTVPLHRRVWPLGLAEPRGHNHSSTRRTLTLTHTHSTGINKDTVVTSF